MITLFKQRQRQCKTTLAVGFAIRAVQRQRYIVLGPDGKPYARRYKPEDVVANLDLNFPGATSLNKAQMRQYIKDIVPKNIWHQIIIIDELDQIFPARSWQQGGQTDALVGLWQDEKMGNIILGTTHVSDTGVDLLIRESAQRIVIPHAVPEKDMIRFSLIDKVDRFVVRSYVDRVSEKIFPYFSSWQTVR